MFTRRNELMARLLPIPQPRRIELDGQHLEVSRLVVEGLAPELAEFGPAIAACADRIVGNTSDPALPLDFQQAVLPEQGYELVIEPDRVRVRAADALGALYAVRTLADVWDQTHPHLPVGRITDHPTLLDRGVFIESIWSSALMGLEDWCELVDRLAALKFNRLGIALYGCWDLRHDGERAEFLMVPLRDFPELRTPFRVRTYSPEEHGEVVVEQLPRMFVEGLLPAVVEHARTAGVDVVPFFAGPGHSTLIPRQLPVVSAVDAAGSPKGYGYCVTRAEARGQLRDLFSALVSEYLEPNGLDRLCVQGDECYPILNLDPEEPLREVSPTCECPSCRKLSAGEQLVEYFLLAGEVLQGSGVHMLHWHDSLYREEAADLYAARLDEQRLPRPTLVWWRYSEPLPTVRNDGFRAWVAPSPGQTGWLLQKDMSLNVEGMLRAGVDVASGVMAYHSPDPSAHKNVACLADLAWNWEGSGGSSGFKRRWAERAAPADADACAYAYALGESVISDYGFMTHVVDHLLPYFSTSPRGVISYPEDLLAPLAVPSPAFTEALRQARDTLRAAVAAMPTTVALAGWPPPNEAWQTALDRIAEHVDLWLALVELARHTSHLTEEAVTAEAEAVRRAGVDLLDSLAEQTPPYLYPILAREHWYLVHDLRRTLRAVKAQPGLRPASRGAWHAWRF